MESLPPEMLLCIINTKLRDFYSSLDELCDDLDYKKNLINEKLNSINYFYNIELNKFIFIEK